MPQVRIPQKIRSLTADWKAGRKRCESGETSRRAIGLSDAPAGKQAFVYEVFIDEPCRNQGYGQAAMRSPDDTARSLGAFSIGLHVFGHNATALHVYRKAGCEVTDYKMAKRL